MPQPQYQYPQGPTTTIINNYNFYCNPKCPETAPLIPYPPQIPQPRERQKKSQEPKEKPKSQKKSQTPSYNIPPSMPSNVPTKPEEEGKPYKEDYQDKADMW
jgi:hypothetical protein